MCHVMIVINEHTPYSIIFGHTRHVSKIKTMIINDSIAFCLFLEQTIDHYLDCDKVYTFHSAKDALDSLEILKPDVLLLDLEMPYMDGLTFLESMNKERKIPTIIVSSYVNDGSKLVSDAMVLGALDSISLPSSNTSESFEQFKNLLHHKIIKSSLKSPRFLRG